MFERDPCLSSSAAWQMDALASSFSANVVSAEDTCKDSRGMIVTEIGRPGATTSMAELFITLDAHLGVSGGRGDGASWCALHTYVFAADATRRSEVQTGEMDWFPMLFGERQGDYIRPLLMQDLESGGVWPLLYAAVSAGSGAPADCRAELLARRPTHSAVFSRDANIFTCSVYHCCGSGSAHVYTRGTVWGPRLPR